MAGRPRGRPFTKGQSGNPRGRKPGPTKRTLEIRDWSKSFLEDAEGRERMLGDYRRGRLSPALVIELMNRAYGKVREVQDTRLQVTGEAVKVILAPREKK